MYIVSFLLLLRYYFTVYELARVSVTNTDSGHYVSKLREIERNLLYCVYGAGEERCPH